MASQSALHNGTSLPPLSDFLSVYHSHFLPVSSIPRPPIQRSGLSRFCGAGGVAAAPEAPKPAVGRDDPVARHLSPPPQMPAVTSGMFRIAIRICSRNPFRGGSGFRCGFAL